MRISLIPALFAAAALSLPVLVANPAPAQADTSVTVSGKVKIRARSRVRVRPRRHVVRRHHRQVTPRSSARLRFGGNVYWGGGIYVGPRYYAAPPPPPPPAPHCDCDQGYYAEPPPPAPAPGPYLAPPSQRPVMVSAPARKPLPRLGLGVFAGSVDVNDRVQGDELGLLGRLRLTRRLYLEGELAAAEMTDGSVDRRVGGALLFDFSPRSRFSLNILGGLGAVQSEVGDAITAQGYGELGLGVTYRPTKRFHLAADVRGGSLAPIEEMDDGSKAIDTEEEGEPYARARVSALVYF